MQAATATTLRIVPSTGVAVLVATSLLVSACESQGCEQPYIGSQLRIVAVEVDGASTACLDESCGPLEGGELILFDENILAELPDGETVATIPNVNASTGRIRLLDSRGRILFEAGQVDLPEIVPFGKECGSYAVFGTITVDENLQISVTDDLDEQPETYAEPAG